VNIRISIVMLALLCILSMLACSDNGETTDQTASDSATNIAESRIDTTVSEAETDSLVDDGPMIRNADNPIVTLSTNYGDMTLELYHDVAPVHVDSFIARTNEGYYDSTIFHRVWRNFIIQGGDPLGTGKGNAGYYLKAEFSDLPHVEGTLSMVRSGDPNSASSQFFICLARTAASEGLDGTYTVFGHLLKGYEALHAIGNVECMTNPANPKENTKPVEDVMIVKAYLSDAEGSPL